MAEAVLRLVLEGKGTPSGRPPVPVGEYVDQGKTQLQSLMPFLDPHHSKTRLDMPWLGIKDMIDPNFIKGWLKAQDAQIQLMQNVAAGRLNSIATPEAYTRGGAVPFASPEVTAKREQLKLEAWARGRLDDQRQRELEESKQRTALLAERTRRGLTPPPLPNEQRDMRQTAGFAAFGLSAAGMPGLAGVAGSFAAFGPAGAAVAGVSMLLGKMKEMVEGIVQAGGKLASSVMTFDPISLNRGFADLAGKVPVIGGIFGGLINVTLDLSEAMMATAKRLSQYDAGLAMAMARVEIRRIERDMERAARHGPEIVSAVERRLLFEEKWSQFMDKMMPTILNILEQLMGILEENSPAIASAVVVILKVMVMIAQVFAGLMDFLVPGMGALLSSASSLEAMARRDSGSATDSWIAELDRLARRPTTATPIAR